MTSVDQVGIRRGVGAAILSGVINYSDIAALIEACDPRPAKGAVLSPGQNSIGTYRPPSSPASSSAMMVEQQRSRPSRLISQQIRNCRAVSLLSGVIDSVLPQTHNSVDMP